MYPSDSSVFMSAVVREFTGMICRLRGGEGRRDQVNVWKLFGGEDCAQML